MKLALLSHIAEKYHSLVEPICRKRAIAYVWGRQLSDLSAADRNGITIVLADPPSAAEAILALDSLAWVQSTWAGVDGLLQGERLRSRSQKLILTGVRGVHGQAIADYVTAYVTLYGRSIFIHRENQIKKHWQFIPYEKLQGQRVCLLGTGAIGTCIAERFKSMGLYCSGISRSGSSRVPFERVVSIQESSVVLADADIVVSVLPLTDETKAIVDATYFAKMKKGCLFVNVGRGPTVDENALIDALHMGQLRGAILDVFDQEPLPETSPLWSSRNVILTPHVAGISFVDDIVAVWERNLLHFEAGEEMESLIDPERGY